MENNLINEINAKLAQWASDISNGLNSKASLDSPNFTGTPTAPLPEITNNSDQIASTS